MSPIIDFVRRQLSSSKLHEEQHTANAAAANTTDLISRSGYLNEGKYSTNTKSAWIV